jgi:hypothetical protein
LTRPTAAIERLALPENRALLEDALSRLPSGYEVNQNLPALNQALHLWLIAQHTPGVSYPLPAAEQPSEIESGTAKSEGDGSQRKTAGPAEANPAPPIPESTNPSIQPFTNARVLPAPPGASPTPD